MLSTTQVGFQLLNTSEHSSLLSLSGILVSTRPKHAMIIDATWGKTMQSHLLVLLPDICNYYYSGGFISLATMRHM